MEQKTKRNLRYRQKIDFIVDKFLDIPKKIKEPIVIDAVMDIIAMMVKDKGKEVSDDYHKKAEYRNMEECIKKSKTNISNKNF